MLAVILINFVLIIHFLNLRLKSCMKSAPHMNHLGVRNSILSFLHRVKLGKNHGELNVSLVLVVQNEMWGKGPSPSPQYLLNIIKVNL
jgi:hypothetical protein